MLPAMDGVVESARGTTGQRRWYRRVAGHSDRPDLILFRAAASEGPSDDRRYDTGMDGPSVPSRSPGDRQSAALVVPERPSRARSLGPSDGRPGPLDRLARPMRDLRISVTDRCNFRCTYCMPREIFG